MATIAKPATAASQAGDIRNAIKDALAAMRDAPLPAGAAALLSALRYTSARVPNPSAYAPQDFAAAFPADNVATQSEREFLNAAQAVSILFQVTTAEIEAQAELRGREGGAEAQGELPMGDAGLAGFDGGNIRSFIFAAVALKPRDSGLPYSRGHYARFIREINKRIAAPVVALFRTEGADEISIAFIHRRQSKTDAARDVMGSVAVIRGVSLAEPHSAHSRILAELALPERQAWMSARGKPQNFDGLLAAWLDALDTDALTDKFYKDLFRWYQRAIADAKFPTDEAKGLFAKEQIIRLITRILFVWFIKEKGLVSADLFIENKVGELLKDYDAANGDSYYRAVLQNLFFATLNTEIAARRFSRRAPADHRNPGLYRYQDLMAKPDDALALFNRTPFVNGGLFDCLDDFEGVQKDGRRVDCFTDNPAQRKELSVPNSLFFDADGGLIPLFERYKFTVEENTPLEREVALDPELLGNVFENLLAAYNPETEDATRKRTGSYYTPRAVVDYMVDEALAAALSQKASADDADRDFMQARLRYLLDYGDAFEDADTLFSDGERESIVKAVADLKIIDPAVGSGAFPMGILHKLTLALRRVDPQNKIWESLQKRIARDRASDAFDTPDQAARDAELNEISDFFQRYRDSDFGRKLYLIQNSIYGVDIQPVAAQIAKLRFFISLAIEQEASGDDADNRGVRPLPNLETRFVAADALIGMRGLQGMLTSPEIQTLQDALLANRERHFHAGTRQTKRACVQQDRRLRESLTAALRQNDFAIEDAAKVAKWDAFDQNAPAADWFDAEYMFGVKDGFDVVIGNPPYIQLQRNGGEMRRKYQGAGFATFASTGDIYQLFYEKGMSLLTPDKGLLAYITSNSWLKAEYGKNTRRMFAESHAPLQLIEMGKDVFQNAIVDSAILLARSGESAETAKAVDMDKLEDKTFPPDANRWGELRTSGEQAWSALPAIERGVMDKIESVGTPLKDWDTSIYRGVTTGYNAAFIIDGATRDALVAADPKSAEIIKPVLRGRDIQKYKAQWAGLYLIYARKGIDFTRYPAVYRHMERHKDRLERKRGANKWYELQASPSDKMDALLPQEKLIWLDLTERGRFAYDDSGIYCEATTFFMTGENLKYLCGVLNSSVVHWYLQKIAPTSGMGTLRWKKAYVGRIPVPPASGATRSALVGLLDEILQRKASRPRADASGLERRADGLVAGLYGLSAAESAAIAGGVGG